jgi:dipeptidase D
MSNALRGLEPRALWNHFADLNAVPRPSKKEERVRQFMVDFGKSLNLPTRVDGIGNVIITKPASAGMEYRATVVLQSHIDMVHQKNSSTDFNFDTQGIEMFVDGDWVKAKGTTLGADNGIGVASIMAILASTDIAHPAIDALFTIDEETGMTGALGLKSGELTGKFLLNLDTEDDDELSIGCAGGVDVTIAKMYEQMPTPARMKAYRVSANGLNGGHSGMDIHKGLGNANKLLNRVLWRTHEHFGMRLAEFDGGSLRNAIPREAVATVVVREEDARTFEKHMAHQFEILRAEYATTDPNFKLAATETAVPANVMDIEHQEQLLAAIYSCQNGIYRMSPNIKDLVQTSNNLARVLVKDGEIKILCLTRSSVDSEKMDLAHAIEANFYNIGADVEFSGSYPGWAPLPDSDLVKLMSGLYRDLYKAEPKVAACHAGLECGILGTHYPEMQMISFGPNIRGAHSPDEKVQISSVQKYWGYLLEALKRIPEA